MGRGSDEGPQRETASFRYSAVIRDRLGADALRASEAHDHSIYLDQEYLSEAAREMSFEVSPKILIAGDIHGELDQVQWLAYRAEKAGASVIAQVGDLGYWPHTNPRFIQKADKILERAGVHMIALDGNHENFAALGCEHPDHEQFRVLGRRVLHAPRGASWQWRGRKFLSLGGAHSVDREWRIAREKRARKAHQRSRWLWWPEEDVSDSDQAAAQAAGSTEILLTHDAPSSVRIPVFEGQEAREDPETMANRQKLQRVLESSRPELVVHGHYHRRYSSVGGRFDFASRVEGLDRDGSKEDSILILDLDQPLPEPE